ncbi:hypothetical protein, partial [Pseudomonas viridiflava]|uniref:hypothetical protein n=1 Tax=Pseudomonas viridiflava TaxID=33069 RepID=UPI0019D08608
GPKLHDSDSFLSTIVPKWRGTKKPDGKKHTWRTDFLNKKLFQYNSGAFLSQNKRMLECTSVTLNYGMP